MTTHITASLQRTYDHAHTLAPYLITLYPLLRCVQTWGTLGFDYPQARAIVDDFGDLVVVSNWR